MKSVREYNIKDKVRSRWKQEFLSKATQMFEQPQDQQEKDVRIAELERRVGKRTMKVELKKSIEPGQ